MKFLMVAAAAAALGTAGAAQAQYPGQYGYGQYGGGYSSGSDWNNGRGGYSLFEREYRHTIEGIRHGLSDGTYSRRQADRFHRELENIRYDAMRSMRYGNYQDGFIRARMTRLHQRMHFKHDRNHDRYDGYNGYGSNGGYSGYQLGYGSNDQHDHDDHDD